MLYNFSVQSERNLCFPYEMRGEKPYTTYVHLERGMKQAETRTPQEVLYHPVMGIPESLLMHSCLAPIFKCLLHTYYAVGSLLCVDQS